MIGAQRAAAQRRRQANELIREFSFFMHFINANCAQLTWQKERETETGTEREAANCSDNAKDTNQKAAAETAALTNTTLRGRRRLHGGMRGKGRRGQLLFVVVIVVLLFCRIFELFKLKLKFASANAKGMGRVGGGGEMSAL